MRHGYYNLLQKQIKKQSLLLEKAKNVFSEYTSIYKKRKLISTVQWTEHEKKAFNMFWKENYGKTIPTSWHRLYESMNGKYNTRYFPEYLYSIFLEPAINPAEYANVFSDKNILSTLFSSLDEMKTPITYVSSVNGSLFDSNRKIISQERAEELFLSADACVCKPTVDSGSGHGVLVFDPKEPKPPIDELEKEYKGNFIIQEKIIPCKELEELSPNALSTFRVMTFLTDDGIYTAPLAMRIGTGKSKIDNIHAGGLVVAVSDTGTICSNAYCLGYGDTKKIFEKHPDTNIKFVNYSIPKVDVVLNAAKKAHSMIPHLGMVSWDFSIDDNYQAVLIEVNTSGQSVWFPQVVSGKPLFGDKTEYFIKKIRRNRK